MDEGAEDMEDNRNQRDPEAMKAELSSHVQEIMESRPYKLVISKPVSKSQENKKNQYFAEKRILSGGKIYENPGLP